MERPLPKKYTYKEPMTKEQRDKYVKAGSVKSEKKARNARDNGLLGGWQKTRRFKLKAISGRVVRIL